MSEKQLIDLFYRLYPCEWDDNKMIDKNWRDRNDAFCKYSREHHLEYNQFPRLWNSRPLTDDERVYEKKID